MVFRYCWRWGPPCRYWFYSKHRGNILPGQTRPDQSEGPRCPPRLRPNLSGCRARSGFLSASCSDKIRIVWKIEKYFRGNITCFLWGARTIPWKLTGSPNLSTDSTNTRSAFTWIQAVKHSPKLTFSHLETTDIMKGWRDVALWPDEGTELFLLVGVEFGQLALAGLELLLVIGEIPHVKPVFSRFLLELVNNFLEASDRH